MDNDFAAAKQEIISKMNDLDAQIEACFKNASAQIGAAQEGVGNLPTYHRKPQNNYEANLLKKWNTKDLDYAMSMESINS